jgi:hypothetical protein
MRTLKAVGGVVGFEGKEGARGRTSNFLEDLLETS